VARVDAADNSERSTAVPLPCQSSQKFTPKETRVHYARARYARSEGVLFASLRPSTE